MKDKIRKDFHVHLKKVKLNPDKYPTRNHYPFNLDLFQKTHSITLNTPVTFFVGENGSGKSTLDEPETALSPTSQLELLELLKEAGHSGQAQFIIASHSPILLACPGARILTFDDAPVRQINYEDTNHYRIYREFMANPKKYMSS
jgi:predicted ATPase